MAFGATATIPIGPFNIASVSFGNRRSLQMQLVLVGDVMLGRGVNVRAACIDAVSLANNHLSLEIRIGWLNLDGVIACGLS